MVQQLPRHPVSSDRIRAEFNRRQIDKLIGSGLLVAVMHTDRELKAAGGWPQGTRMQYIQYYNHAGDLVVGIHRYADRTGNPITKDDPKQLVVDGVEWYVSP